MKVGIVVPHLGSSQLAYLTINQIGHALTKSQHDFTIFFQELVKPCLPPPCAAMNVNEVWGFNGLLIGTDVDSAISISQTVNPSIKMFYVWDLEWLRRGKNNFLHNMQAYRAPNLLLAARSQAHADAIENYANRKVDFIEPNLSVLDIINEVSKRTRSLHS